MNKHEDKPTSELTFIPVEGAIGYNIYCGELPDLYDPDEDFNQFRTRIPQLLGKLHRKYNKRKKQRRAYTGRR